MISGVVNFCFFNLGVVRLGTLLNKKAFEKNWHQHSICIQWCMTKVATANQFLPKLATLVTLIVHNYRFAFEKKNEIQCCHNN